MAVRAGAIVAILGLLGTFAPLATDMYLPSFRLMAEHFGVDEGSIEATLSVFFLGLAVGQAIYGPLIDRYGRGAVHCSPASASTAWRRSSAW